MGNMEDFVAQTLMLMDGDPARLEGIFGPTLSQRDELLLNQLDLDLGIKIDGILDRVLSGTAFQSEIELDQAARTYVLELTAIRRVIHELIATKGRLNQWRESLN
jgi:hypothetical protein